MSNYKIKVFNNSKKLEDWNEFVKSSPTGTVFHKSYWLEASDQEFRIYGLYKGQELFAGFPVVIQNTFGTKRAKLPSITPWLGPVYQSSKAKYVTKVSNRKKMNRELAKRIKEDFDCITLNFSPSVIDLQPYIWESFSTKVRYTYRLDLTDLDEIWDSMSSSRRRNIRRAKKDGVTVEKTADFDVIFELVKKTFARQNKGAHFKKRAQEINKILSEKNKCQSFISKNSERQPIAAVYVIWGSNTAYYLFGGYDSEHSHHGASALAMWRAIQYCKSELELDAFDFEGSMVQKIEKFFRKFGGELVPYYSVNWGNTKGRSAFAGKWLSRKIFG